MEAQKRTCSSEYYAGSDRLSEMPDEVIVHILSYMPITDAVRTMLIRRFGNLWTLVPTLNFESDEVLAMLVPDGNWTNNDVKRFNIFVRNVLILHKRPFIDKFYLRLQTKYDDGRRKAGDDITMWLSFALDKQAKEIVFEDIGIEFSKSSDFPNFISQSLVTLQLCDCTIYPQLQVDLGSLKELIFDHVAMSEEAFRQFIRGCPSLQELHIYNPFEIRNLSFSAPNIRTLFLSLEKDDSDSDDLWLLNFPNLKSLHLGLCQIPNVIDIDVSSVRDVYLTVLCFQWDDENGVRMFKLLLKKFSQCEVFTLIDYTSEPFLHLIDELDLLQIRWKRVVLSLRIFCQSCLLGFYQLMKSSKDLEELDIYTNTTSDFRASTDLPPVELSNPCVMPKLKTVTLHGYPKSWEHQLQLIEFLLKSATVLEKLVFVPNKLDKLDFVMHVSSFQSLTNKKSVTRDIELERTIQKGIAIQAVTTLFMNLLTMAMSRTLLNPFLLNSPYISTPFERIKGERLKDEIRVVVNVITAGLAFAVNAQQSEQKTR
ncbi:hypothetical protein KSS87_005091 [Heliosperma pusillum]|nr:hypothetical protein KSS87_001306 [Heliosperma pusillum]KAH9617943.1 hypothetical protein KSS87_005091 [Heliosperma pusillum]